MNENQLSKRLARVGEFVPENSRLADIGSDHAYLPVALVLQKKIPFAIAGEVVQGPFKSATQQVLKSGLTKQIIVRLADGLTAIEKEDGITAVTICGMGGGLIRNILDTGWKEQRIDGSELLILQPNVGEQILRIWLMEHGYTIIAEDILEENNKRYEIIVAQKGSQFTAYSEEELLFGPHLLKQQSPIFVEKWQGELKQCQRVLAQLKKSTGEHQEKKQSLEKEIKAIKEVLPDGT